MVTITGKTKKSGFHFFLFYSNYKIIINLLLMNKMGLFFYIKFYGI